MNVVEILLVEDTRVVGEEAEQKPHQHDPQVVAGKSAGQQRVVDAGHQFRRLDVGRVLGVELVLLVTGDESEAADVLVQVLEGELDAGLR
jgi:hypothetical protein